MPIGSRRRLCVRSGESSAVTGRQAAQSSRLCGCLSLRRRATGRQAAQSSRLCGCLSLRRRVTSRQAARPSMPTTAARLTAGALHLTAAAMRPFRRIVGGYRPTGCAIVASVRLPVSASKGYRPTGGASRIAAQSSRLCVRLRPDRRATGSRRRLCVRSG